MKLTEKQLLAFWDKIYPEPNSGCWLWGSSWDAHGYGTVNVGGKTLRAHRVAYSTFNGPIPDGMTVDHSCWVRCCVNPQHLGLLTRSDNAKRQRSRFKSHCINGHPLSGANLYLRTNGQRDCRECIRDRVHKYQRKKLLKISDQYRSMIYFAVATLYFYRGSLDFHPGETPSDFYKHNRIVLDRVSEEALNLFSYELSFEQMMRAICAYLSPGQSVDENNAAELTA